MHPEILRELAAARDGEMRARAREARLARMASKAVRDDHATQAFGMPVIPDYVDGSFRAAPAQDKQDKASGRARRVPVGRRAA
jgi:hypothetical protein